MSMIPEDASPEKAPDHLSSLPTAPLGPPPGGQNEPSGSTSAVPYQQSWQSRLLGISFAIFAFEIGLFLVIIPWVGEAWELNYFQSGLLLHNLWDEPYFRGAISGIGLINIYIALLQVARLLRRSS